jgi:hypothetical protein
MDEVFRHVPVIGEKLLGVLRKIISAVAEGGVVVEVAHAGIETHAPDDLGSVQPLDLGIGVQLIKIADAQGKIGVGEKLDGLRLGKPMKSVGTGFFSAAC